MVNDEAGTRRYSGVTLGIGISVGDRICRYLDVSWVLRGLSTWVYIF